MSLPPSSAAKLQLEIVGGLHSGVNLALEDGKYVIGSKAEADIVLRDREVAPQHVIVYVEGNKVRVEAVGGDLLIGEQEIMAGHGFRLRLPADLMIGHALLRLSRNDETSDIASRFAMASQFVAARPAIFAAGALGVVFALTVLAYSIHQTSETEAKSRYEAATKPVRLVASQTNGTATDTIAQAQKALEGKLKAGGIESISVSTKDDAQLVAKGRIDNSRSLDWTAIQSWFDHTYAPGILLIPNVVVDNGAKPAFRLQSIYYGDNPYIIIDSGMRYYQGAIMSNGWVLEKISGRTVTLKKDDLALQLNF